ncbi:MAG TPA: restriction endonuclease subunit S [Anaerovoracaceae bacterium]|nr:restriction endonuclease subunit S [Anaerovoracaceae bacterium]
MAEKNKKPEIRFKGFTDEWNEQKYSETFTNIPNNTLSRAELNYNIGLAKNVHYGDVLIKFGELLDVEKNEIPFITDDDLANKFRPSKLQNGDVVIADAAEDETVGKCTELVNVGEEIVVSGLHTIPIRPTLFFASGFLGYFMNSSAYHNQLLRLMQGTKVSSISKTALQDTAIVYPIDKEEQSQIGKFFKQLNQHITLHQRKYDKLITIKKAMLEKMFPKNGADVPEIRFNGFTETWKEQEINAMADRYDNLRVPITANKRVPGSTPYYGANGIQDYVKGHTHHGEFILVAEDGANDLKNYPVQYVNGKIWVNNHAHVLQAQKNIADNKFLMYAISQTNIEPFLVGGGRAKLNAETMMKIGVYVPLNIQEQEHIGWYFTKIDKLITLHQQELVKLKSIKKACLGKMFV